MARIPFLTPCAEGRRSGCHRRRRRRFFRSRKPHHLRAWTRLVSEPLEPRLLLDGGPEVANVLIGSDAWTVPAVSLFSLADPDRPLPWININRIQFVFDRPVEVVGDALTMAGVNTPSYAPLFVGYDEPTRTATWELANPLGADRIIMNLAGEATDANPIDDQAGPGGTLLNCGRDFQIEVNIIPGDGNRDGAATITDLVNIASREVRGEYQIDYDFDGDGAVGVADLVNIASGVGEQLPAGLPIAPGPPLPHAHLANDTGLDQRDGITFDPTITGNVRVGSNPLSGFRAGLDEATEENFVNVLPQLQPDGRFSFDQAEFETIFGGPLTDGSHTLSLVAEDSTGSLSTVMNIPFDLDTTAPFARITPEEVTRQTFSSFEVSYNEVLPGSPLDETNFSLAFRGGPNDGQPIAFLGYPARCDDGPHRPVPTPGGRQLPIPNRSAHIGFRREPFRSTQRL